VFIIPYYNQKVTFGVPPPLTRRFHAQILAPLLNKGGIAELRFPFFFLSVIIRRHCCTTPAIRAGFSARISSANSRAVFLMVACTDSPGSHGWGHPFLGKKFPDEGTDIVR